MPNRERDQNPYELSAKKLICPKTGKPAWFESLVALQREGIDNGVRPQNPRNISKSMRKSWRGKVWNYWRDTLSERDQRATRDTTQPSAEKHTGSGRSTYGY